ncbi:lytic transglycosylase domain-containing protein [Stenotrophomonas sp. MMGLT7]|uniref:lytic transglycosylase domain-containing protein n=1 Tax=Stenotrophomonas sp. MMGLT7 TaxID=2901227 RepID=UPI001E5CF11B|nr:lytic transglycosylase domain-containing protein [Stenotrophomonas sp. MMGLT7]MCD7098893.1 lytic transglycosylase domain-containing protein [Stenotrophomonas sp. MMGLT7]
MRGMLLPLGILAAAWAASPASAGTLYKCIGDDGIPSYVSKRTAGASCSVVSSYVPASAAPGRAQPRPSRSGDAVPSPAPAAAATAVAAGSAPRSVAPVPAPVAAAPVRRVVKGEVYSYMKDGVRHYTSARPRQVASIENLRTISYSFIETCYACGVNPGVDFGSVRLNTSAYRDEIAAAAREFGVDEAVVRAIIHAESAYNPVALSRAGAQGLMQLMPATARRFGVTDSYDAVQNIRGGVQYLAWLLRRFDGNLMLAAAGYNAGEGAVDRHGGVPPYSETQRYVQRVGVLADRYRSAVAVAR